MHNMYEVTKAEQPTAVTTHTRGRNRFTRSVTNLKRFLQSCAHPFYDSEGNHLFKDGSLHYVTEVIR